MPMLHNSKIVPFSENNYNTPPAPSKLTYMLTRSTAGSHRAKFSTDVLIPQATTKDRCINHIEANNSYAQKLHKAIAFFEAWGGASNADGSICTRKEEAFNIVLVGNTAQVSGSQSPVEKTPSNITPDSRRTQP